MMRIYERSLGQSYASAYRQGILIAKASDYDEALFIIETLTDDSYQCFAVDDYGTVTDLGGSLFGHLASVVGGSDGA